MLSSKGPQPRRDFPAQALHYFSSRCCSFQYKKADLGRRARLTFLFPITLNYRLSTVWITPCVSKVQFLVKFVPQKSDSDHFCVFLCAQINESCSWVCFFFIMLIKHDGSQVVNWRETVWLSPINLSSVEPMKMKVLLMWCVPRLFDVGFPPSPSISDRSVNRFISHVYNVLYRFPCL